MKTPDSKLLDRFVNALAASGDVSEAMRRTRVSRARLDTWTADPVINEQIDSVRRTHFKKDHGQILFESKILPKLETDCVTTHAALAAKNLPGFRWEFLQYAKANNAESRRFFIALGQFLSGERKADLWDKADAFIAKHWHEKGKLDRPLDSMTAPEAITALRANGIRFDESNYRKRLERLGLAR